MKKKYLRILNASFLGGLLLLTSCDDSRKFSQESNDNSISSNPVEEYTKMLAPTNIIFNADTKTVYWNTVAGVKVYDIHVNGVMVKENHEIETIKQEIQIEIENKDENSENSSDESSDLTSDPIDGETTEEVSTPEGEEGETSDSTSNTIITETIEIIPTQTELSLEGLVDFEKSDTFLISIRAKLNGNASRYSSVLYDKNVIDADNSILLTEEIDDVTYLRGINLKYSKHIPSTLIIPDYVEVIDINAFQRTDKNKSMNDALDKIEKIVLPTSLTKISEGAFDGLEALKYVDFSKCKNLEEIGDYAFKDLKRINNCTVNFPKSLKRIGANAFNTSMFTFNFENDNQIEEIGDNAFYKCSNLKSVNLTSSIKSIGEGAFNQCNGLTSVTISKDCDLTTIAKETFKGTKITDFELPLKVDSIGENAFNACKQLLSFKFDSNSVLSSIGDSAFEDTELMYYFGYDGELKDNEALIKIPSTVSYIGKKAFSGFAKKYEKNPLSSYSLVFEEGSQLNTIGESSFEEYMISSINIPDSVEVIETKAFRKTNLDTINFGKDSKIKKIQSGAFDGTPYVKKYEDSLADEHIVFGKIFYQLAFNARQSQDIDISSLDVITITDEAFKGLPKLESISLPNNLQYINDGAFERCQELKSISLPASLKEIGNNAFKNCKALSSINFANNSSLEIIGDSAFECGRSEKDCNALTSINIPDSVKTIGSKAFYNNRLLKSVNLPDNVEMIGESSFEMCTSLTSVNIPASIISIGANAFNNCRSLSSLTFDDNSFENATEEQKVLYSGTFAYCTELTSVVLPKNILTIEKNAFGKTPDDKNKETFKLKSIEHNATTIDRQAFYGTPYEKEMAIDGMVMFDDVIVAYIGNDDPNFNGVVTIPNNARIIGADSFSSYENKSEIKEIILPYSVTEIGDNAFQGFTSLEKISTPDGSSLTHIGSNAFANCKSLTSFELPNTLESIGEGAFSRCVLLESINLSSELLTEIPNYCFEYCNSITSLKLGNNIKSIGTRAFYKSGLVNVTLSSELTNIADEAFAYIGVAKNNQLEPENWDIIPSLETVNFENTKLTYIGKYAFADNLLTKIELPQTSEEIVLEEYCFANSINLLSFTIKENYVVSQGILTGAESVEELTVFSNQSIVTIFGGYVAYVPSTLHTIYVNGSINEINSQAYAGLSSVEKIVFEHPEDIEIINSYAFYGCSSLESLNLPNVSYIGDSVFFGCSNLDLVLGEDNIEHIGSKSFVGTNFLDEFDANNDNVVDEFVVVNGTLIQYNGNEKHVVLDDSITAISGGAFSGNQTIESITFGKNITKISAGSLDSCTSLQSIILTSDSVASLDAGTFDSLSNDFVIKVKASLFDDYKKDVYWSLYGEQIVADE